MASRAGVIGNLPWQRGTSQPGVRMAPRGAQHKEAITAELKIQIQKLGINKFIDTYGSSVATAILGYETSKLYSDIKEPKKVEPLKYIPGIHGPKTKEQEEIEKIGQKETFPIQEWDKSYTDTGTTIPEPEKIEPPVSPPIELPEPKGIPIEEKTWKDYILTQAKTKDITKQTKDLVTKEPEFGALTETEKQTALLEKGDKPDYYARIARAVEGSQEIATALAILE
jgi:hypothetical protein